MSSMHEFREARPEQLAGRDQALSEGACMIHVPSAGPPPIAHWQELPASLTVAQRFRLVEIAHETGNTSIRNAAIRLLLEAENPGVVARLG